MDCDHKKDFEWQRHLLYQILINQEKEMSALTDLQGKVTKLQTDLTAYIASKGTGATDTELTALAAQVDVIDATIQPPPAQ